MSQSLDQFIRDMIPPDDGSSDPQAAHDATLPPGEDAVLPGHSVDRLMAAGGMGAVYLARQQTLGREVAVKVMTRHLGKPQMAERFRREAWVLGRLEHPNIVPIHELGVDDAGRPFYSMKLVKGRTLQAILNDLRDAEPETLRTYPLSALLGIFLKMCDALAFAHSQGIIHRDLKPENIMVGAFGEVLVMDWGLAKIVHGNDEEPITSADTASEPSSFSGTLAGSVMGTPQYMSPEQALGQIAELDERSDIFSLGGILYAIMTLRPPVDGTTLHEVLEKVRTGIIAPPSTMHDSGGVQALARKIGKVPPRLAEVRVPAALSAVVMKALQREKTQRYQNVPALQADIEAYLAGFATSAEEATVWKQFILFVRRHRAASTAAAAALIMGATLGTQTFLAGRRAEQALHDLSRTAPVFYAQARFDFDQGKNDDAIQKIGYAIQLDESNPDYHLFRANLNQSAQRFALAIEGYRRVLELRPGDKPAQTNLALSEKLLRESGGVPKQRAQEIALLAALRQQNRLLEAAPLALRYDVDLGQIKFVLDRRLTYWSNQPGWSGPKRVETLPDGTFEVALHRLAPGDLSVLKDQPVSSLKLDEAGGTDISTLPFLPLKKLSLYRSKVSDITPLRGMPLEDIDLSGIPVTDLSPLRGMKIHTLNINRTPVKDFSPLAGMPLVSLQCYECKFMFDLEYLRGAPLETFRTSQSPFTSVAPLAGLPLKTLEIRFCPVSDIAPLANCTQLEELVLRQSLVVDLTPLAKLRLRWLDIGDTRISSIEPLRGLPLRFIRLQRSLITDVSPLADCPELEEIILPEEATGLEALRKLPKLQRISTTATPDYHPMQTAKEFWEEYDKEKGK